MANKLLNWAFDQTDLVGAEKWILIVLAHRADRTTHQCCDLSLTDIAVEAGIERRTVTRGLMSLETMGKISRERHGTHGTAYTVLLGTSRPQDADQTRDVASLVTRDLQTRDTTSLDSTSLAGKERKGTQKKESTYSVPFPIHNSNPVERERDPFEEFWTQSTKRGSKVDARKAWNRLKVTTELNLKITAGMMRWKASEQWQDEKYQPHVSSWLRREGWDEIVPAWSNGNGRETKTDRNRRHKEALLRRFNLQDSGSSERGDKRSNSCSLSGAIDLPFDGADGSGYDQDD